jgi:ketosteroid isomerase-like protein
MDQALGVDDAERAYNSLDVVPEEYPGTRPTKVAQPVLARNAFAPFTQRLPDAVQKNAKFTFIFDEFHDVDHDVTRGGLCRMDCFSRVVLATSWPMLSGRKMRFTGTTVLRVEDGKIAEEIGLDDGVTALQQLGILKAA